MSERDPDGQITVEVRGHVLLVGIDRPEKLNGLTPKMFWELAAAYERLDEDPELRVGVLFAHGKHFTAGLGLPKFAGGMKSGMRKGMAQLATARAVPQPSARGFQARQLQRCMRCTITLLTAWRSNQN